MKISNDAFAPKTSAPKPPAAQSPGPSLAAKALDPERPSQQIGWVPRMRPSARRLEQAGDTLSRLQLKFQAAGLKERAELRPQIEKAETIYLELQLKALTDET